jgi:hypothetical protein
MCFDVKLISHCNRMDTSMRGFCVGGKNKTPVVFQFASRPCVSDIGRNDITRFNRILNRHN